MVVKIEAANWVFDILPIICFIPVHFVFILKNSTCSIIQFLLNSFMQKKRYKQDFFFLINLLMMYQRALLNPT